MRQLWHEFDEADRNGRRADVFRPVDIAQDGGLSDVTEEKLLYKLQYVYAAVSVIFIVMNTLFVTSSDWRCALRGECTHVSSAHGGVACVQMTMGDCDTLDCVRRLADTCQGVVAGAGNTEEPFMLLRMILDDKFPGERIIAVLELSLLWFLVLRTIALLVQAVMCYDELLRWVCVVKIFWQTIPSLSCYSLMRLLYYVTPSVIGTQAYYRVTWMIERMDDDGGCSVRAVLPLVMYIITRIFCLVVGFDAFLVKFRLSSHAILRVDPTAGDFISCALFLFQLLGVVNLVWFVRERLFLFVFGQEDGNMTGAQKAREIVWNALVSRKIYENFGLFKFLIVMLGFDDYDFQVLVLEHAPDEFEVPRCPQGHALQLGRTPWPTCDVCGRNQGLAALAWGCRRCNFDACEACKFRRPHGDPMPAMGMIRSFCRCLGEEDNENHQARPFVDHAQDLVLRAEIAS